jgi:methionyl-tRNA formyltransferase
MPPTPLRIIFMGSPEFAVPALRALHSGGHEIVVAYTQPPKPAGRGHAIQKTAVQAGAEALHIPVLTPKNFKNADDVSVFQNHHADIAIVAAYGLLLPPTILTAPRLGCLNIHGSLLPRWRGAAPLQRAILAGDKETGITIMQMDAGLDTGAMLLKGAVPITPTTTTPALHDMMAALGAALVVEALQKLQAGSLPAITQPDEGVTYAAKLTKEEGLITWHDSAVMIDRKIRALNPWPGCYFTLAHEMMKIKEAVIESGGGMPGMLLDDKGLIACGEGSLRLLAVQRPGKAAVSGADFLNGLRLKAGDHLS